MKNYDEKLRMRHLWKRINHSTINHLKSLSKKWDWSCKNFVKLHFGDFFFGILFVCRWKLLHNTRTFILKFFTFSFLYIFLRAFFLILSLSLGSYVTKLQNFSRKLFIYCSGAVFENNSLLTSTPQCFIKRLLALSLIIIKTLL